MLGIVTSLGTLAVIAVCAAVLTYYTDKLSKAGINKWLVLMAATVQSVSMLAFVVYAAYLLFTDMFPPLWARLVAFSQIPGADTTIVIMAILTTIIIMMLYVGRRDRRSSVRDEK